MAYANKKRQYMLNFVIVYPARFRKVHFLLLLLLDFVSRKGTGPAFWILVSRISKMELYFQKC